MTRKKNAGTRPPPQTDGDHADSQTQDEEASHDHRSRSTTHSTRSTDSSRSRSNSASSAAVTPAATSTAPKPAAKVSGAAKRAAAPPTAAAGKSKQTKRAKTSSSPPPLEAASPGVQSAAAVPPSTPKPTAAAPVLLDYMWHSSVQTKKRKVGQPTRSRKEKIALEDQVRMACEMSTVLGEGPPPVEMPTLSDTAAAAGSGSAVVPLGEGEKIMIKERADYEKGCARMMSFAVPSSSEGETTDRETAATMHKRHRPWPVPAYRTGMTATAATAPPAVPPPASRPPLSPEDSQRIADAVLPPTIPQPTSGAAAARPSFLRAREKKYVDGSGDPRAPATRDLVRDANVDVARLPPPLPAPTAAAAAGAAADDALDLAEKRDEPKTTPESGTGITRCTGSDQVQPRDYTMYTDRKFKDARYAADMLTEKELVRSMLRAIDPSARPMVGGAVDLTAAASGVVEPTEEEMERRRTALAAKGFGEASVCMESFDLCTNGKHTHGKSTYPTSSCVRCFYDHHRFAGIPVLIPLKFYEYQNMLTVVSDVQFCSFSCARSWLESGDVPSHLYPRDRLRMLTYMARRFFGLSDPIRKAPPLRAHVDYGGRLTTDQWRSFGTTHVSFLEYPLAVSVPSTMITEIVIYAKSTRDQRAAMITRVFDSHTQRQAERPEKGHVDASEPNARRLKEGMGRPLKHRQMNDDKGKMVTLHKDYLDGVIAAGKRKRDAEAPAAHSILAFAKVAPTSAAAAPPATTLAPSSSSSSSSTTARPMLAATVVERSLPSG